MLHKAQLLRVCPMIIGGFQRFSLIDYPNKICAIVFTQGCNFRCPYCHNPELIGPEQNRDARGLTREEIVSFLEQRKGKLDAVTITGGEPLLQPDLGTFLAELKDLGYSIKLDTNGSLPLEMERLIGAGLIDYIAMDIKSSLNNYERVVRVKVDTGTIMDSIRIIMGSGLDYEFRTTVVKPLLEKADFYKIGRMIQGSRLYVLQRFVSSEKLENELSNAPDYSDEEFGSLKGVMEGFVTRCIIR